MNETVKNSLLVDRDGYRQSAEDTAREIANWQRRLAQAEDRLADQRQRLADIELHLRDNGVDLAAVDAEAEIKTWPDAAKAHLSTGLGQGYEGLGQIGRNAPAQDRA